jgi:CIC family chloride channel protein
MATLEAKRAAGLKPQVVYLQRLLRVLFANFQRDVRSSEMAQIVLCALIGVAVGVMTDGLHQFVNFAHKLAFELPKHTLLSAGNGTNHVRLLFVPALGGLTLGVGAWLVRRYRSADIVDPVEANAMFGGRMSFRDSVRLTLMTIVSNAAGASLGMEAGYSQFGSAVFSRLGQHCRLRREDLRIFVTAGAGAAIAAAFNAPLSGAFYGYELILGSYTPRALAPVAVATVSATLASRAISRPENLFAVPGATILDMRSYLLFGAMGVLAAAVGIAAMLAVTWSERGLRFARVPDRMRPFVGGAILSFVALAFPQVLGSGHGAIQFHFDTRWAILPLALLLAAKLIASAISVGSGFRGGLFSSSLFLGCLYGGLFVQIAARFVPGLMAQENAFLLVGMASVAAAIVGAPLTMVFLILEGTGDFPVTIGALVGVITAATIVRITFGYSFSTWRFHARGLGIRGAHDIGWIADLTVSRLMRADPQLASTDMTLRTLRAKYPPGAHKTVYAIDRDGRYAGAIDMMTVHDPQYDDVIDAGLVADIVNRVGPYLLPSENIRGALLRFETSQTEVLPVLSAQADPRVIGYLTEAYALRRYTQELERRRAAELGDEKLFSLGQSPGA